MHIDEARSASMTVVEVGHDGPPHGTTYGKLWCIIRFIIVLISCSGNSNVCIFTLALFPVNNVTITQGTVVTKMTPPGIPTQAASQCNYHGNAQERGIASERVSEECSKDTPTPDADLPHKQTGHYNRPHQPPQHTHSRPPRTLRRRRPRPPRRRRRQHTSHRRIRRLRLKIPVKQTRVPEPRKRIRNPAVLVGKLPHYNAHAPRHVQTRLHHADVVGRLARHGRRVGR